MFSVASAAAARHRRKSFGRYLQDRLLVPHHFTHRDILGLGNSGGGAHLINFSCTHHKSGTEIWCGGLYVHGRGLKRRWSRLNDFCSKYGYFQYLRLMNFILNRISISVWSWLAGIRCGHLPQPSQCWTNIWS